MTTTRYRSSRSAVAGDEVVWLHLAMVLSLIGVLLMGAQCVGAA